MSCICYVQIERCWYETPIHDAVGGHVATGRLKVPLVRLHRSAGVSLNRDLRQPSLFFISLKKVGDSSR